MRIELVAKNYQVNEKIDGVISKKVSKLEKYFDEDAKCRIYLKKENARTCKLEMEVNYKSNVIRAQAYTENFYDAIDLVIPKLEKQIYKYRSKFEKQLKQSAFKEAMFSEDDLRPLKLVKTKKFQLQPMDLAEAMEEFEMLGHTFYVYLDKASMQIKVLYLRDDGNLGLIDPEI